MAILDILVKKYEFCLGTKISPNHLAKPTTQQTNNPTTQPPNKLTTQQPNKPTT